MKNRLPRVREMKNEKRTALFKAQPELHRSCQPSDRAAFTGCGVYSFKEEHTMRPWHPQRVSNPHPDELMSPALPVEL